MFDVYNLKLSKYITDRELFGAILEWDSFSLHIKKLYNIVVVVTHYLMS